MTELATLRLYAIIGVLTLWAVAIKAVGSSNAVLIVGLIVTAIAAFVNIRESAHRYRKHNGQRPRS